MVGYGLGPQEMVEDLVQVGLLEPALSRCFTAAE